MLFTGYNTEEVRRLGIDARNCAVLDTACSSTVCGDNWVNSYIESLNKDDKAKVKQSAGQKVFKFGGGTCLKSKGEYSLPAMIAGKEVTIKTDVVESDIPLLLSRTAMKKAAIKLDLETDTAVIMGKDSGSFKSDIIRSLLYPNRQIRRSSCGECLCRQS